MDSKDKQLNFKDTSVIARSKASLPPRKQGKHSQEVRLFSILRIKINLSIFIIFLLLMFSFVANTYSSEINVTNIWYEKVTDYTHLTIKASGVISEYEVS